MGCYAHNMSNISPTREKTRLYYFDWLRVIAFAIILFEHSAEIFVDWNFWIKNRETSSVLTQLIAFFLPWRMPLLFIISGAAVVLSFERKSILEYLKERSVRLLVPLIFSIFFIIPPQLHFIQKFRGSSQSLSEFYQSLINLNWDFSVNGNIHFMHLWYLAYLFIYCLIFLPALEFARSPFGKTCKFQLARFLSKPYVLLLLGLLVDLPYYFIGKYHPFNVFKSMFVYYFPFFVCGVVLWSSDIFREAVKINTYKALAGAVLLTSILYYFSIKTSDPDYYFQNLSAVKNLPVYLMKSLNQWLWVIGIFGLAIRYLNFQSAILSYATKAVYPFYILHQTVIVIIGFFVIKFDGSVAYKLTLVNISAFFSMYLFYTFFIGKADWLKVLFGVKPEGKKEVKEPVISLNSPTAVISQQATG